MRMYCIRVDFSPMTFSSKMRKITETDTHTHRERILEDLQSSKVKVVRNHQELGKGKEATTPRVFREHKPYWSLDFGFWTPKL